MWSPASSLCWHRLPDLVCSTTTPNVHSKTAARRANTSAQSTDIYNRFCIQGDFKMQTPVNYELRTGERCPAHVSNLSTVDTLCMSVLESILNISRENTCAVSKNLVSSIRQGQKLRDSNKRVG